MNDEFVTKVIDAEGVEHDIHDARLPDPSVSNEGKVLASNGEGFEFVEGGIKVEGNTLVLPPTTEQTEPAGTFDGVDYDEVVSGEFLPTIASDDTNTYYMNVGDEEYTTVEPTRFPYLKNEWLGGGARTWRLVFDNSGRASFVVSGSGNVFASVESGALTKTNVPQLSYAWSPDAAEPAIAYLDKIDDYTARLYYSNAQTGVISGVKLGDETLPIKDVRLPDPTPADAEKVIGTDGIHLGFVGPFIAPSEIGTTVASLVEGKIPASQLPEAIMDVEEYNTVSEFPAEGESAKLYLAKDTNLIYRWGGSVYVEVSQSLALGETATTAYPGDRGKQLEEMYSGFDSRLDTLEERVPVMPIAIGIRVVVNAVHLNQDPDLTVYMIKSNGDASEEIASGSYQVVCDTSALVDTLLSVTWAGFSYTAQVTVTE